MKKWDFLGRDKCILNMQTAEYVKEEKRRKKLEKELSNPLYQDNVSLYPNQEITNNDKSWYTEADNSSNVIDFATASKSVSNGKRLSLNNGIFKSDSNV